MTWASSICFKPYMIVQICRVGWMISSYNFVWIKSTCEFTKMYQFVYKNNYCTVRIVSAIILVSNFNWDVLLSNHQCCQPLKDEASQTVYLYFKLNSARLICYDYIYNWTLLFIVLDSTKAVYRGSGVNYGNSNRLRVC